MDSGDLYATDICTWAEQQVTLLRNLAVRIDIPNELDLPNIVEEIEDVGISQLRSVASYIRLILSHMLLIAANADANSVPHWTREVATFRGNMVQSYQRSMPQRIDIDLIWRHATEEAGLKLSTYLEIEAGLDVDQIIGRFGPFCPFAIDHLCGANFRFHDLIGRLRTLLVPEHPA